MKTFDEFWSEYLETTKGWTSHQELEKAKSAAGAAFAAAHASQTSPTLSGTIEATPAKTTESTTRPTAVDQSKPTEMGGTIGVQAEGTVSGDRHQGKPPRRP